jgi:hypothetical protein
MLPGHVVERLDVVTTGFVTKYYPPHTYSNRLGIMDETLGTDHLYILYFLPAAHE